MNRIKFIVAEKSYLIRKGIISVINHISSAHVVAEMDNLDLINSHILKYHPDFIVINPNLIPEHLNFLNFEIKTDLEKKAIAITSAPPYRRGLLKNFALVLDVNESKETLLNKIETFLEGSEAMNRGLDNDNELSDREKTILKHVAKGQTNKEIAENLYLSAHTVITHRKNITAKLGIKTISGLTVYAILNNLVSLEEIK
jgi:DNA-binding NarL/FixJ family response regulator